MIQNFIKIAFRNLRRNPGYAAINITGLAIGLACCLYILLYVRHEVSYDRFHENADRIYRLAIDANVGGQELKAPLSPAPMGRALQDHFPEVQHAARVFRSEFVGSESVHVEHEEKRFTEYRFFYTDSSFFDVFSFEVIAGNPHTMLSEPNTVVLTESMAAKYFGAAGGRAEQALGRVLRINHESDYRITGVIQDVPDNAHWQFDFLGSLSTFDVSESESWFGNPFTTYFVLREGASIADFEAKLIPFVNDRVAPQIKDVLGVSIEEFLASGGRYEYYPQPLTDIHLHSNLLYEMDANNDIQNVYTFSVVALLILIIASFNFMNLATAKSANRSKEVGVRKVLGAQRRQLTVQFLVESLLLCAVATVLAVALLRGMIPLLNDWFGTSHQVPVGAPGFWIVLVVAVLVVGLLSGAYPAFFLTSFKPVAVLKGKLRSGVRSGRLRSGLVIAQFSISIVLMAITGLVFQQMQYVQSKKLGFDREHVVILDRSSNFTVQSRSFKEELRRLPGVISVSGLNNVPGKLMGDDAFRPAGAPADELNIVWMMYADEDIVETLGLEMALGEGFEFETARDSSLLILNQEAAGLYGWDVPLGERLISPFHEPGGPERVYEVVGVVQDFHFESLHQAIRPIAIELARSPDLEYMAVRVAPGRVPAAVEAIEDTWASFYPETPLVMNFLDENFDALYRADQQHGRLLGTFAGLAILIACLGLFGLAAYMTEQRVKEVGVRKVLGATVSSIVILFSVEFLKKVGIAFVIGIPVALFLMGQWLERFAYRTEISWEIFALSGFLAGLITVGTISYHAIRTALTDPAKTLRYE